MEPHDLPVTDTALYGYHSGAPTADEYERAVEEIRARLDARLAALGQAAVELVEATPPEHRSAPKERQRLVPTYGEALVEQAEREPRLVVARRGPPARHRARRLPRAVPGPLLRVRHRRAGHGLAGRDDGAGRPAAGRALLRLLPLHAAERADLQQRDRALEGDLRRLARRPRSRRAGPLAPVGARHLRARRDAGDGADRAVLRERGAGGRRLGGPPRARARSTCGSSACRGRSASIRRRSSELEPGRGTVLRPAATCSSSPPGR